MSNVVAMATVVTMSAPVADIIVGTWSTRNVKLDDFFGDDQRSRDL
jgi:uncharacterized protein YutD